MKKKLVKFTPCGLGYVYLENPPIRIEAGEEYIDIPLGQIELAIARAIIQEGVPLRGLEVKFLRKALKLPRNTWAKQLGISAAGIFKWENEPLRRLSRVNEAAIRILCAEALNLTLDYKWSSLVLEKESPERLNVAA